MARDEGREVDRKRAATGLARIRSMHNKDQYSNVFHVLNSTVPVKSHGCTVPVHKSLLSRAELSAARCSSHTTREDSLTREDSE